MLDVFLNKWFVNKVYFNCITIRTFTRILTKIIKDIPSPVSFFS